MRARTKIASAVYALLLYGFIYLPVVVLVLFSFQGRSLPLPPLENLSFQWYEAVFSAGRLLSALGNSVWVAVCSSALATLFALIAAYGLARYRPAFGGGARWLLMAPLTVSYLIIGLGILVMFKFLGISRSLVGVGIGHVVINLPIAFGIIFSQMGEHQVNIERAARDLGAKEWQVITFVTVPMLWPALIAAFCLSTTLSWDEFIIALLLSHTEVTLPVEIWNMMQRGFNAQTNAVGSLVFFISIVLFIAFELLVFRKKRGAAWAGRR